MSKDDDDSPFSQEALRKQITDLPTQQGGIGATVKPGDFGVAGSVKTELGKPGGLWAGATGSYWQRSKEWGLAVWLGWTGKDSSKT